MLPSSNNAVPLTLPAPFIGHKRLMPDGDTLYTIVNGSVAAATLTAPNYGIAKMAFDGHQQRGWLASNPTTDIYQGL